MVKFTISKGNQSHGFECKLCENPCDYNHTNHILQVIEHCATQNNKARFKRAS